MSKQFKVPPSSIRTMIIIQGAVGNSKHCSSVQCLKMKERKKKKDGNRCKDDKKLQNQPTGDVYEYEMNL